MLRRMGRRKKSLVSVIVPTFNRSHHVVETLNSVYHQTYRPIEVIIVDDGSTDDSIERIEGWCLTQLPCPGFAVKVIRQPNMGASSARNLGVAHSVGEFVQFVDSDDLLVDRKLEDGVAALTLDKSIDLAYCLSGEFIGDDPSEHYPSRATLADLENDMSAAQVALFSMQTPLPLFRYSLIEAAGPWREDLASLEDWEYIGRVAHFSTGARQISKVQVLVRAHGGPRLSKKPWGDPVAVYGAAFATISLYELVDQSSAPLRVKALSALRARLLSCLRVSIASGNYDIARAILNRADPILKSHPASSAAIATWRVILKLPRMILGLCFRPYLLWRRRGLLR